MPTPKSKNAKKSTLNQKMLVGLEKQVRRVKGGKRLALMYSPKGSTNEGAPVLLVGKDTKGENKKLLGTKRVQGVIDYNTKNKGFVIRIEAGQVKRLQKQIKEDFQKAVPMLKRSIVMPLQPDDLDSVDADEAPPAPERRAKPPAPKRRRKKAPSRKREDTPEVAARRTSYRQIRSTVEELSAIDDPMRWLKTAVKIRRRLRRFSSECPDEPQYDRTRRKIRRQIRRMKTKNREAIRDLHEAIEEYRDSDGEDTEELEDILDELQEARVALKKANKIRPHIFAGLLKSIKKTEARIQADIDDASDEDSSADDDSDDDIEVTAPRKKRATPPAPPREKKRPEGPPPKPPTRKKRPEGPPPVPPRSARLSVSIDRLEDLSDPDTWSKEATRLASVFAEDPDDAQAAEIVRAAAKIVRELGQWEKLRAKLQGEWDAVFARKPVDAQAFVLVSHKIKTTLPGILDGIGGWWQRLSAEMSALEGLKGISKLHFGLSETSSNVYDQISALVEKAESTQLDDVVEVISEGPVVQPSAEVLDEVTDAPEDASKDAIIKKMRALSDPDAWYQEARNLSGKLSLTRGDLVETGRAARPLSGFLHRLSSQRDEWTRVERADQRNDIRSAVSDLRQEVVEAWEYFEQMLGTVESETGISGLAGAISAAQKQLMADIDGFIADMDDPESVIEREPVTTSRPEVSDQESPLKTFFDNVEKGIPPVLLAQLVQSMKSDPAFADKVDQLDALVTAARDADASLQASRKASLAQSGAAVGGLLRSKEALEEAFRWLDVKFAYPVIDSELSRWTNLRAADMRGEDIGKLPKPPSRQQEQDALTAASFSNVSTLAEWARAEKGFAMIDDKLHQKLKSASSFIHTNALFMANFSHEIGSIFQDCHEKEQSQITALLEAQIKRIEERQALLKEARKLVLKPLKSFKKRAKLMVTTLEGALNAMFDSDSDLIDSVHDRMENLDEEQKEAEKRQHEADDDLY